MIPFVKASAYGNDFLIVESAAFDGDKRALTRQLCDRKRGVGADGVEWISPGDPGESDVIAALINADGSEAEISGNGTRCVAAWIVNQHPAKRSVRVATGAGVKRCELISVASSGASYGFAADMGAIRTREHRTIHLPGGTALEGVYIDCGNPHFVIIGRKLPDDWRSIAQNIQNLHSEFPHGINVEFVSVHDRTHIEAYFFERGAGETHSSGTGSCASATAARFRGLVDTTVEVIAPGGVQTVVINGDNITLRGTAELICRGEAYL